MAEFSLDERLEQDSIFIKDLKLSKLLLMNDSNYPWFILVPRKEGVSELFELSGEEQKILMSEISQVSKVVNGQFKPKKINVANLGNIVPQLHIHIIARFEDDKAWPGPIWGKAEAIRYEDSDLDWVRALCDNLIVV